MLVIEPESLDDVPQPLNIGPFLIPGITDIVVCWYFTFFIYYSGVGYALCERLLDEYPDIKLCLVCRNKMRGETAVSKLLFSHPGTIIYLAFRQLDTYWVM